MISHPARIGRGCCCTAPDVAIAHTPSLTGRRRSSLGRRGLELAGWLIPGTLLAFFPKCPLCVAGYVALATGLGLSLTVATYLRWTLLLLCAASLTFMARRWIVRMLMRRPA